ncbi:hypothetical protein SNK03_010548 [Fusarium graminearum]|nr:hypothetical protein FGSG_12582 [Fusarium graminearum PH-1]ESU10546.1 hypothetical protein FGSG_12582 [Fusarium graminearum PH-1]EYB31563.1 hypothetical protein FG05_12582 [Fusarium graminearum]|eukprot:XP_011323122.1 hypothetical protein FGSG_12582 [Fusarium graminearum PH-1]
MSSEAGVRRAVASFHANLPLNDMRCDLLPNRSAAWLYDKKGKKIKLSKMAAEILVVSEMVSWNNLKAYQTQPVHIENRRWDPLTATLATLATTGVGMVSSASDIVVKPIQALRPVTPSRSRSVSRDRSGDNSKRPSEEDVFGRPAGMDLPPAPMVTKDKDPQHGALAAVKGSASGVVTEGMRNAPKLYGGKAYDPGAVTDWKSGGIAAGKNFAHGMVEGIGGIVMEPVRGAKKEGAAGAAKGVGIGLLNLGTKVGSGAIGLFSLVSQGAYLSARALVKRKMGKSIMEARKIEGRDVVERSDEAARQKDRTIVIEGFEALTIETKK